jgi:hypothetical protein
MKRFNHLPGMETQGLLHDDIGLGGGLLRSSDVGG